MLPIIHSTRPVLINVKFPATYYQTTTRLLPIAGIGRNGIPDPLGSNLSYRSKLRLRIARIGALVTNV